MGKRGRYAVAGAVVASLVAWWLLLRWWFLAGDDYLFLSQGGDPRGQFSFATWARESANEWLRINGRTADSMVRLVLRPGTWFYPLFAPLLITGTGLALGFLIVGGRLRLGRAWLYCLCLLLLPWLMWAVPSMAGDTVFWTPGAMNYVFPMCLAGVGLGVLVRELEDRRLPWPAVAATALLLAFTDSLQEVASTSLAAVAVVVIITRRGQLSARAWVLVGAMLAACAVHLCAPGLWARSALVADTQTGSGVERVTRAFAASTEVLWNRTVLLWVALLAAMVWFAADRGASRRRRWLCGMAALMQAAFAGAVAWYEHRLRLVGPEPLLLQATAVVLCAVVAFTVTWWALASLREDLGWVPLIGWAAFVGSCVFVLGAGVGGARAHFIPAMWLAVVVVAIVAAVAAPRPENRHRLEVALLVALALPAAMWFDQAWVGLKRNYSFVQEQVVAKLTDPNPPARIVLPKELPVPEMSYWNSFLMPRYEESLKIYYSLPSEVEIVNE